MTDTQLGALFFLQLGVILLVCRLVGWCAVRIGQPQVVAEMVAGFLMGPSFFGWVAPGVQAALFPAPTLHALFVVSQIGLVLYMFCVGLEFRPDLMLKHGRSAAAVSVAGIVVPFTLGGALALWLLPAGGFFAEQVRLAHAVLFVGAAMSITAFPMLARIIDERGIAGTALGTLTLAAGAMDDAAAWIILAVVLGSFSGSTTLAISAALGGLFYVVVVLLVARPLLRKLDTAAEADGRMAPWMLTSILSALAIGAWFTDTVGIYAVFGAFVLGAAMPRGLLSRELQRSHRASHDGAARAVVLRLHGLELSSRTRRLRLALDGDRARVPCRLRRKRVALLARRSPHGRQQPGRTRRGHADERTRNDGAHPAEHRASERTHHANLLYHPGHDGDWHDADGDAHVQPCLSS